jgi:hypothetical protein
MNVGRDWSKYARALDMRLAGASFDEIGDEFDVSRERARQMVQAGAHRLAYRVFKGVPRFLWRWDTEQGRWIRDARGRS